MRFDVITLFPEIISSYVGASVVGRALKQRIASVHTHDLRAYGIGRHKSVDDRPYGGGAGMVLSAPPILSAAEDIFRSFSASRKRSVVVFSAKGKQFTQKHAYQWSRRYDHMILVCGRYEGIDERVRIALRAQEVSIGPYVLTDGEIPALAVISAIIRLLPGAIRLDSLQEESFWGDLLRRERTGCSPAAGHTVEYPHYTRPEVVEFRGKKYRVPSVLLSGDHSRVAEWRREKVQKQRV